MFKIKSNETFLRKENNNINNYLTVISLAYYRFGGWMEGICWICLTVRSEVIEAIWLRWIHLIRLYSTQTYRHTQTQTLCWLIDCLVTII